MKLLSLLGIPCDSHYVLCLQSLGETAAGSEALESRGGAAATTESSGGIDVGLLIYFALWYVGNYYVSDEKQRKM